MHDLRREGAGGGVHAGRPAAHGIEKLRALYESFDKETAENRKGAACARGCAFCCTDAGRIDITTLEGLAIRDAVAGMPRSLRISVQKALLRDMKKREAGLVSPCPFLNRNHACMIYDIRPFACRRVYSLRPCSRDNPPLLSPHVMKRAGKTIEALQRLDENGYSGHLSFILHMLESPRFLETYRADDFRPEEIMVFGKSHRIIINKMAASPQTR